MVDQQLVATGAEQWHYARAVVDACGVSDHGFAATLELLTDVHDLPNARLTLAAPGISDGGGIVDLASAGTVSAVTLKIEGEEQPAWESRAGDLTVSSGVRDGGVRTTMANRARPGQTLMLVGGWHCGSINPESP
jgi:hypothetical protein